MQYILPSLVFAPMLGALISYMIGRRSKTGRNVFVCLLLTAEFALAGFSLYRAFLGLELSFAWEGFAGFGLHFKMDGFRALYTLIAALMWMMTGFFSPQYFAHYHNRNRYYFFTLMTLGATAGVFLSDDLYTTFIFFEIMSFTSYTWVAHEETPGAMRAAETYLGIAVVGGMVTLMGLFVLYHRIGTLSFAGLREAGESGEARKLYLPGILVMFGFAAKAGMFPLHIWLPKAHPVAPAPASALLSGVLTKAGVFGVLVTSCNLFLHNAAWGNMVLLFGVATMFGGALLAMFSVDLKRTLACSSMSQIGFILVGVGMQGLLGHHNALAVQGTLLHMVNHSLIKLCLFMAAGTVYMNLHRLNLNDIRGFGRNKIILHFAFLMGALGISGIPLWNGYISKSLLHESILEYVELLGEQGRSAFGYSVIEWIFVITGGMTFSYMLKLYIALFWEKNPTYQEAFDGARSEYLTPLSAFALLGSALILPALGMLPDLFMTNIAELGQGFMHGESPAHAVAYFSFENLFGAAKSLVIGAALYLFVIRRLLMEEKDGTRLYVNRWPSWLDIENLLIRSDFTQKYICGAVTAVSRFLDGLATSKLFYVWIPAVITAVTRFLDELATSKFFYVWLPAVITGLTRALDETIDRLAVLIGDTVLSKRKTPRLPPVGTWITYALGRCMNAVARLLNRTVLRRHPMAVDFEYRLDVDKKEAGHTIGMLTRSLSFGLLLLSLGLVVTCWYLLRQG
ncbi:MAG: NADH dehydrogenase [Clostridia bacterium]|nr:NADH dehydrogenase [Clostridia bacterium]